MRNASLPKATAPKPPSFALLIEQFFTEYLVAQRAVSPRPAANAINSGTAERYQ